MSLTSLQRHNINYELTFVSSLSFTHLEVKLFFDFIFDSLKKHVFYNLYSISRIIMSDQATRIKILMLTALSNLIL